MGCGRNLGDSGYRGRSRCTLALHERAREPPCRAVTWDSQTLICRDVPARLHTSPREPRMRRKGITMHDTYIYTDIYTDTQRDATGSVVEADCEGGVR